MQAFVGLLRYLQQSLFPIENGHGKMPAECNMVFEA